MAWITSKRLYQESVINPHTGLKQIVSVKISGNSKKAEIDAYKRLMAKVEKVRETRFKFSDVADLYLAEQSTAWKPSSLTRIVSHIKQIEGIIGDGYMDALTAGFIRTKFAESGKSNRTLNDYEKTLKTFWRWAYKNDYVKTQEVSDKLMPFRDQPRKERIQDKYLETWEIKKLLEAMERKQYKLLTTFLILTGCRVSEAIALNDRDVWGSVIHITKTYDHINRVVTAPKSLSSRREIYIQPELKECIQEIRKYEEWQRGIFGYESDLFFSNEDGGYLNYGNYKRYFISMTETALGRRLTPHSTRHTHTSILCAKGMTLDEIAARLGHDDSKVTRAIYLHRTEELKAKENKKMDAIRMIT